VKRRDRPSGEPLRNQDKKAEEDQTGEDKKKRRRMEMGEFSGLWLAKGSRRPTGSVTPLKEGGKNPV